MRERFHTGRTGKGPGSTEEKKKRRRLIARATLATAGIVAFVTTYALILPAITIDEETADLSPGISVERTEETRESFVSEREADAPWAEAASEAAEAADGEEDSTAGDVVAAVAQSQEGYAPTGEDGETLYGDAMETGPDSEDWSGAFTAWCIDAAGVSGDDFPVNAEDPAQWAEDLQAEGADGETALWKDTDPQAGDVAFLDTAGDGETDQTGIVSGVETGEDGETVSVDVTRGNVDGQVETVTYEAGDEQLRGYGDLSGATGSGETADASPLDDLSAALGKDDPEEDGLEYAAGDHDGRNAAAAEEDPGDETGETGGTPPVIEEEEPGEELPETLPVSDGAGPAEEIPELTPASDGAAPALSDGVPPEEATQVEPMAQPMTAMDLLRGAVEDLERYPLSVSAHTEDGTVLVTARYAEGTFPEGVTMTVETVAPEDYGDALAEAAEQETTKIQAMDITFRSGGEAVEPDGEVKVSFQADFIKEASEAQVLHVDEETGEAAPVASQIGEDQIVLTTDSFSVYAIVYTVDFHWMGDTFSISGGGAVTLSELIAGLHLDMDHGGIADVTFSSPDLVAVVHVEEDTTLSALIEERGLEIQASADREETAPSQDRQLFRGDWVLISLRPFTSEETLTVTMADGEVVTLTVTDAQVNEITDGGRYVIYYNSGGNYYVLKGDGTTERVNTGSNLAGLNDLKDEYLWTFEHIPAYNSWNVHSNSGLYLTLDGNAKRQGIVYSYAPMAFGTYFFPISQTVNDGFSVSGMVFNPSNGWFPWDFYYLGFDSGRFVVDGDGPVRLYQQKGREYTFTVKTQYDNRDRGTVGGKDMNGVTKDKFASFISITNTDEGKTNKYSITAQAGTGYEFDHWELNDRALTAEDFRIPPTLSNSNRKSTIPAKGLSFPYDDMILKAVFKKVDPNAGVYDYSGTVNEYLESLKKDPLRVSKTAEVFDYDNRIYQVDLTASGDAQIITPDIELSFVTDISRSMYFPSKLQQAGTFSTSANVHSHNSLTSVLDGLHTHNVAQTNSSDHDEVYYVIANYKKDATVYALRYRDSSDTNTAGWYAIDASYDVRTHEKTGAAEQNGDPWTVYGSNTTNRWFQLTNGNGNAVTNPKRYGNDGNKVWLDSTSKVLDEGIIYYASDDVYRLSYLQQAVDISANIVYNQNQNSKIGLVTFAKTASENVSFYEPADYSDLLDALNTITPTGNTNQRAGLERAQEFWRDGYGNALNDPDHKRVVILITDGAPNPGTNQPNSDWSTINAADGAATVLKDPPYNATLYTVGLSVNDVEGAREGLTNAASPTPDNSTVGTLDANGHRKYAFFANDGEGLITAVLEILQSLFTQVDLYGSVTDTVDPAFYPVNPDGSTLEQGYFNEAGQPITEEQRAQYDRDLIPYHLWIENSDVWSVTWYNQRFDKETTDADGVTTPGLHKQILVKAKEDFLGGNTISTNSGSAQARATYFKEHVEPGQTYNEEDLAQGPMKPSVIRDMPTPYVNVDELRLDRQDTEWTVFQFTSIDPLQHIKDVLYGDIRVCQVETATGPGSGIMGNSRVSMPSVESDGRPLYVIDGDPDSSWQDDDAAVASGASPATFPLGGNDYTALIRLLQGTDLTADQWDELVASTAVPSEYQDAEIKYRTGSGSLTLKYYGDDAYGHGTEDRPVGTVTLTLTQKVREGEEDLNDSPHQAVILGKKVEEYVLTVTYDPTPPENIPYHTGNWLDREIPADRMEEYLSVKDDLAETLEEEIAQIRKDLTKKKIPEAKIDAVVETYLQDAFLGLTINRGLPTDQFTSVNTHIVNVNAVGAELPATGGPGDHPFRLAGCLLLAGAALGLGWKRKYG